MTPNEVRLSLLERVRDLTSLLEHGCLDGNCVIEKTEGMHTNGGCNCWKDIKRDLLDAAVLSEEVPKFGRNFCYEQESSS